MLQFTASLGWINFIKHTSIQWRIYCDMPSLWQFRYILSVCKRSYGYLKWLILVYTVGFISVLVAQAIRNHTEITLCFSLAHIRDYDDNQACMTDKVSKRYMKTNLREVITCHVWSLSCSKAAVLRPGAPEKLKEPVDPANGIVI